MASNITMDYNFLGKSGIMVSNICLGTMTFGTSAEGQLNTFFTNPTQTDEATSCKIMDRYAQLGGNFIDTANIYSYGKSEQIVGTWLKKQRRDDIVVATKVRIAMDLKANNEGLSRRHIVQSCEESLGRLQTDYIDLYQAHNWDNATPIEETFRTFDDLIRCGKIRYYGYSNVCGWQLQKIVEVAKQLGLNPCISLQQQYNLLQRSSELEEFMVCENEGIALLPWSPLKGGMLTGKFKRDEVPDPKTSREGYMHLKKMEGNTDVFGYWDILKNDDNYWKLVDVMEKIAKAHGKSVPQVALRWLIQKSIVASVIIGVTSVAQLEDNVGASSGWELTPDEMIQLDQIIPLALPYPYKAIWGFFNATRFNRFNRSNKI